ncbi:MAG: 2-oxoacid:acceptor oxidoreductase family protein [Methanomassiliicoccales archaeon]|nr:2-oxoacid:acceptor oxidoreductase family protein [Methanomassiliicoccales archaeon]
MIKRATGFNATFDRKEKGTKATHYCPGCGHGIIHKLIAEAMADLSIQDRTVFVSPVGCAAFCYYYFDCGNVAGPHGRASAVATGISRALPGKVVISYQGDGDLGAIGFNNAFQAANRGEHFACFFVNNSLYAMTGGQMAPTTMLGQKTTTTPFGRDPANEGYPLKVCEVLNQLQAPVFIERVSVADTKRIMQAKKAVRKALEIQRDGKGYAFVEFLSPCPTNWRLDPVASAQFVTDQMEKVFPLGNFRDRSEDVPLVPIEIPRLSPSQLFGQGQEGAAAKVDRPFKERQFKFSGFGGQGVLSLGSVIAEAAGSSGRFVSWLPSYGPEQRGGYASCSVVISGNTVGSPTVDEPDVLVVLSQQASEKFARTVKEGGIMLYESSLPAPAVNEGVKVIAVPAGKIAADNGTPKALNTAFLGAMTALGLHGLPEEKVLAALDASFATKPQLIERNRKVYRAAYDWGKGL